MIEFSSEYYDEVLVLRDEVLRKPLGLSFTVEEIEDEHDQIAFGIYKENSLVGCLLFKINTKESLKMRQVAISLELQGQGLGRQLVNYAEQWAKEAGYKKLELNARDTAIDFYKKLNYVLDGEPFVEVGIPHRHMYKYI